MRAARVLFPTVLVIASAVGAQTTGSAIEPVGSTRISIADSDHPHVESYLAVDPRDHQHLLAAAMVCVDGAMRVRPYASFDGGKTWSPGHIGDPGMIEGGAADPVVHITHSGVCYFSTLARPKGVSRTFVARSTDGGRTWPSIVVLPNTDRQWLVTDPSRGPFGGRTYLTSTVVYQSRDAARAVAPLLARSDDEGLTFPFRTVVAHDRAAADPAAPLDAVPQEPLVTSLGLLVLTLQGGVDAQTLERAKSESLNAWSVGLMTSDDGGDSFGPARYAPTPRLGLTGTAARRFRSHSATGAVRTAIDTSSGRFQNRIYFVAADYDAALDRFVVRVWYTSDFGMTWGTSVASDAPRGDVANPAIAVNPAGIVAVTWNDRRDDAQGRCWRLYAAVSVDGGEHFLPAQRLSQDPTCTNEPRNWATSGSGFNSDQSGQYLAHFDVAPYVPTRFPMGGDTQGLAADATGVFHAAWINGETGVMQLWYSGFRVDPAVAKMPAPPVPHGERPPADEAVPDGMVDVTRDVRIVVTASNLDFAARRYTISLALRNQGARPLRGDLEAVMRHFLDEDNNGHGLRNLAAKNADRGGSGVGAVWTFEVPGGFLAPGASSMARELVFTFEGGIPETPQGSLAPGFRVYGQKE